MNKLSSLFYYNLAMTSSDTAHTMATATQDNDLIDERFDLLFESNSNRHRSKDRCTMTSTITTGATTYTPIRPVFNNLNHRFMDEKLTTTSTTSTGTMQDKLGGGADTTCFKEDLDDYFPKIRVLPATPSSNTAVRTSIETGADYFNNTTADSDNNNGSNIINEVINIDSTLSSTDKESTISTSTSTTTADSITNHGCAAPATLEAYHLGLVDHYLDILLKKMSTTTTDNDHSALPQAYKDYLKSIHQYYL